MRGDSPCGTTARMAPAASCPEMARAASMMGSTCAVATCGPHTGPTYRPATGPNLFRKHTAHAGCSRLARLHAIFSEPTSVIRHCGRWRWRSLKGPSLVARGLQPLATDQMSGRAEGEWIIHMSRNLPRFSRGPSRRVPICHKCAQEGIVRRCFARVALLRQFPPRPSTLPNTPPVLCCCVLCCAVLCCCVHLERVTVSLRVEVLLRRRALLPLSTPTHPDRSDSLNYGWPSSSVADQY